MTHCCSGSIKQSRFCPSTIWKDGARIALVGLVLAILIGCVNNPDYVALENLPSRPAADSDSRESPSRPSATASSGQQQSRPPRAETPPDTYTVRSGDTLYSIAFRYSMDYERLAAANDIPPPFTIVPGQEIDMNASARPSGRPAGGSRASVEENGADSQESRQISATPLPTEPADPGAVEGWSWPVEGNIVRSFSGNPSGSKGIDIDAPLGESVRAAADGKVVYAGDGLRGYGNLIILEHAGRMLSAYAFTEAIGVEEQQTVSRGDVIAEVGQRGDTPLLHFEIREEGRPVDPVSYLPQR